MSEVLQIEQIFTNVPKGQVAKKDDWSKAFKNEDMDKVIEEVGVMLGSGVLTSDSEEGRTAGQQLGARAPTRCSVPRNRHPRHGDDS